MPKVEIVCDYCGKHYWKFPSDIKNKKNHFCSKECHNNFIKGEKVQRVCKTCGKEFEVYKVSIENTNASGNFCCRECYSEYLKTLVGEKNKSYNRKKRKCPNCGKELYVIPSRLRTYKNRFCSIKCRSEYMKEYVGGEKNANWKGGASKYRGDFNEVKKKYFSGTQFCAVCGTTKGINIHHIIPYRLTQDNSRDNLIPLCRRHHKIVEDLSVKFIELFDEDSYDVAKEYMNIVLRERQFETYVVIKNIWEERHNGIRD